MPAYVIMMRDRTVDQSELDAYDRDVQVASAGHSFERVVHGGAIVGLEGIAPEACIVLRFGSVPDARAWYDSPAYQSVLPHRLAGAEGRLFIVEGA